MIINIPDNTLPEMDAYKVNDKISGTLSYRVVGKGEDDVVLEITNMQIKAKKRIE